MTTTHDTAPEQPEQPEQPVEFTPLLADLMTAMLTETHRTTDRVIENLQAEIARLAAAYVRLYNEVDKYDMLPRPLVRFLDVEYMANYTAAARHLEHSHAQL
jgi:hypothetical protein